MLFQTHQHAINVTLDQRIQLPVAASPGSLIQLEDE